MNLECQKESEPNVNTHLRSPGTLLSPDSGAGVLDSTACREALEVQVPKPPHNCTDTLSHLLTGQQPEGPQEKPVTLQPPALCIHGAQLRGTATRHQGNINISWAAPSWPPILFSIVMKQFRISNSELIGCCQPVVGQSRQG